MNWGKGIAIALTLFIGFIVTLVTILISQKVDLETEDYYAKEINYQQQIDANAQGAKASKFQFDQKNEQLVVIVPADIITDSISIHFYRPNDKNLDRDFTIRGTKTFTIPMNEFKKGEYSIQVNYVENGILVQQKYPIKI